MRNKSPIVLCSHGILMINRDNSCPIIGNLHHRDPMLSNLLETCLRLVRLYIVVLMNFPVVLYVFVTLRSWLIIRLVVTLVLCIGS